MLLPRGQSGVISTVDARGPFRVADFATLAADSLADSGGRLPIDENHATDLSAPNGGPSPARGWMTELQARDDGIWAKVEWSAPGAALMADHAYRFISPVFTTDAAGNVQRLLRAALTNTPNLRGMAALNSRQEPTPMDLLAQLRQLLGLPEAASESEVLAKIKTLATPPDQVAMASQILAPIARAVGMPDGAETTAQTVLAAVTGLAAARQTESSTVIAGLQAELKDVTTRLNTVMSATAKDKAVAYVDGEIARGRVGVKALREHYIEMHQADPARVEKEIGALPTLGASGALQVPPDAGDGKLQLNAEHITAARLLGIAAEDYAKTLAAERAD
ncbi:phage protease [Rhodopseudomonas palustris]|nr:phage protease [Rhodopseudomonas palustris]